MTGKYLGILSQSANKHAGHRARRRGHRDRGWRRRRPPPAISGRQATGSGRNGAAAVTSIAFEIIKRVMRGTYLQRSGAARRCTVESWRRRAADWRLAGAARGGSSRPRPARPRPRPPAAVGSAAAASLHRHQPDARISHALDCHLCVTLPTQPTYSRRPRSLFLPLPYLPWYLLLLSRYLQLFLLWTQRDGFLLF